MPRGKTIVTTMPERLAAQRQYQECHARGLGRDCCYHRAAHSLVYDQGLSSNELANCRNDRCAFPEPFPASRIALPRIHNVEEHAMKRLAVAAIAVIGIYSAVPASAEEVGVGVGVGPV